MSFSLSLSQLGWLPFFQQQLNLTEWEQCIPARIVDYQRSQFTTLSEHGSQTTAITSVMPPMTVGDWVLLDNNKQFLRLLERSSLFSRKAAGTKVATQLIAANVDTLFVVSSLNQDFNLNRLERLLVLAHEAGAEPVVVLTKADLCDDVDQFVTRVHELDSRLVTVAVNALDTESVQALSAWCTTGRTIALLGSSGVGKSTLINTLLGQSVQSTSEIREDDAKGRHTTTSRSLHFLPSGGLLLDTPGMRELQLAASDTALEQTFADIAELSEHCKFSDCAHEGEPGCAVREAIDLGKLDTRRLTNFQKLLREQTLNTQTLAEKRARDRKLGRMYRSVQTAHEQKRRDS